MDCPVTNFDCLTCESQCRLLSRVDPRDPDYSRHGIFATHNCWKCKDGELSCVQGGGRNCEYPHARND